MGDVGFDAPDMPIVPMGKGEVPSRQGDIEAQLVRMSRFAMAHESRAFRPSLLFPRAGAGARHM